MKDLFEVEVSPPDGIVTVYLNAAHTDSFAASFARLLLDDRVVGSRCCSPNAAFRALSHQVEQGARVCTGVDANGRQVGSGQAARTYPALTGKIFSGEEITEETEAVPQENVIVDSEAVVTA